MNQPVPSQRASAKAHELSLTRRKTMLLLLLAGIGALLYRMGSISLKFLKPPRRANEFGGLINVGPIHELPSAGSAPVNHPRGKFWLVHDENGLSAIHSSCTHLECLFSWDTEKQVFVCPCHGSEFDRSGHLLRGPAARDLDRFALQVIDDQQQLIARSDPETAAPLAIEPLLPEMEGDTDKAEPQQPSPVMLQVDTGSRITGAQQSLYEDRTVSFSR